MINDRLSDWRGCTVTSSSNLLGGRFAPRWLYFNFYAFCRRQEHFPGWVRDPTFTAWNSLGAAMALPWFVLLLVIDHYLPFLHPLGHLWTALHLPGSPQNAWIAVWAILGVATGLGLFAILFGGRYERIRREFSAYDRSKHDLAPGIISLPVWFILIGISVHALMLRAPTNMLVATLINLCIFVSAEIVFRLWWRWWCRRQRSGLAQIESR